jgi:diacylglycerol kinase (ATP)
LAAATVIACAAVWRVTALEWCLLVGAIGIVCVAELFNTAIESLTRAIAIGHHPRIRDALDVASGAVLLSAIVAALIGGIVFVPRASAWLGLR